MQNNFRRITGIILLTTAFALYLISGLLTATMQSVSSASIEKNEAAANNAALAATLTVTKTADTNDGICNSDCSLREAIAAAASGDTIVFDSTAFAGTQIIELTIGELVVGKNLNVEGTSASRLTIRRSASAANFRIFNISSACVLTLGKVTISGGVSPLNGGGILINSGGRLNLSNAVIRENSAATDGGGIHNNYGTVNIIDSSLLQNSAASIGGGLNSVQAAGQTVISNSIIKDNTVGGSGGGVSVLGGASFNITNSTIDSNIVNSSSNGGAGIATNSVTGSIGNSVISRNKCQSGQCNGGGINNNSGGSLTVFNSTFADNTAVFGGAILNYGSLLLVNSTLAFNSTNSGAGGGLYRGSGSVRLRNTLIGNNTSTTGPDVSGAVTSLGSNLIGNTAGSSGFSAASNDILNPAGGAFISSLANNGGATETAALLGASQAINAGNGCVRNQSCPTDNLSVSLIADQRLFNHSGAIDIGAFEFGGTQPAATLTVTKTADTNDGICNSDCSLREAIAAAQTGSLIEFASPLFDSPQTITLADASGLRSILIEDKQLTINGRGAQLLTVQRAATAARAFRLFDITNSVVVLNNLTLTGGDVDGDGAGIRSSNSTISINDCYLTGNTSRNGKGAAIFSFNNSVVNLANSTVSGNTADSSSAGGGGIHNESELNVSNSTVSGNAKNGGANNGGGIWSSGTTLISSSTITNNQAVDETSAGGVYNNAAAVTIRNSIIASNPFAERQDVAGTAFTSQGYNLIGNPGAITDFNESGDQVGNQEEFEPEPLDPQLGALSMNGGTTPTHALQPTSPAIEKGKSFGAITDQRGQPRPFNHANLPPADGGDNSDIGAFEMQMQANVAPVVSATPNPITTNPNTPVNFAILANDANADSLTLTITDQPDNGTISGFSATPECSVSDDNSLDCIEFVTYTPNSNFIGTDSFSVKANDGQADSNVFTVSISVNPMNNPPVAVNDSYSVNQSAVLNVAAPGVLANDTDADNNSLTAFLISGPSHGTINLNEDGSFTYTSNAGYSGVDSFEYQAHDGSSGSNVATVNITVKAELTVTKTADTNDGVCDADCSLREAIAIAAPGSTIKFDPAAFSAPQIITLSAADGFRELVINKSLIITGTGAQLLTVRRASNAAADFRIFEIRGNNTVNLSGMTIAGGHAGGLPGGGVFNIQSSQLTISDSHITGNHAAYGGGIFNDISGSVTLIRTTVSGNTSDCVCGGGAGINNDGSLTMLNSTVSGNVKTNGDGNAAGGIYVYAGNVTLTNSTVTDNQAPGANSAGGVFRAGGTVTVGGTIIAGNRSNSTMPDVFSEFISEGYNLIGNSGAATGFNQTGDIKGNSSLVINPKLSALGDYGGSTPTHKLLSDSPAIDKGSSFGAMTDQRGSIRPFDNTNIANAADGADIGAFEWQPGSSLTIAGTIIYGATPNNQAAKYVSGVSVAASGVGSVVTNASGVYSLDDLNEGGTYTVTPSKTGNVNGISAFDATLVLRCVAAGNNCALTDNQKLAADANADNSVSAFDATQILRFVAANGANANTGQVGNWKFAPASRNYSSISGSLSNENYTALLIGEVNGDWTPPANNLAFDENQSSGKP